MTALFSVLGRGCKRIIAVAVVAAFHVGTVCCFFEHLALCFRGRPRCSTLKVMLLLHIKAIREVLRDLLLDAIHGQRSLDHVLALVAEHNC